MHALSWMASMQLFYTKHLGITNRVSKIDETAKTELLQDYFKMQIWHWKISRVKLYYTIQVQFFPNCF